MTDSNLAKLLQIIPSLAAAISFTVLSLAFVHEWAFYYVIGGQFQSLMSITDYFNSAAAWLPWAALGGALAIILTLIDTTRHVPRDAKDAFYRKHRVRWVLDNAPMWSFTFVAVVAGAFQLFMGDWYIRGAFELTFILVWALIVRSLIKQETIANAATKEIIYIVLFGPMMLFSAYVGGAAEAANVLARKDPTFMGRLKGQYPERDWVLLRTLSSGLIVRDVAADRIQYFKWDGIEAFESKVKQPNRNGLICRISGRLCNY